MKSSQCSLRKKCPYSELFWSIFSRIRTEYGEIRSIWNIYLIDIRNIPPYSVRMRENVDQNNFEYRHFLRNVLCASFDTYTITVDVCLCINKKRGYIKCYCYLIVELAAGIYLLKVSNSNTRKMCEICSKLIIKETATSLTSFCLLYY